MNPVPIELAKKQGTMLYSELAQKLQTVRLEASSFALFALLDAISREEDKAGRGMLSAVVVNKSNNQPGPGFFDLARDLGRDTRDDTACWLAELKKVHAQWSGAR